MTVLHCSALAGPDVDEHEARMRDEWRRYVEEPARDGGVRAPVLEIDPSPFRTVLGPVLRLIEALRARHPGRPVAVVQKAVRGASPAGSWSTALASFMKS